MGIFTTALGNKKISQILIKYSSPYFRSALLVIWPLTALKGTHFSELSISRFFTHIEKAQGCTLHFRTPDPRSENQNGRAATNPTQNSSTYTVVSFQFTTRSIFPVKPTLSRSLLQKFPVWTFLTARVHIHLDTRPLKTSFVTLPPFKLSFAGDHTVTCHEQTVLEPRVPSDGVDPGDA